MLTIQMKKHLDLKTLKLCHLEKVKQFSKHFLPIFFSNWNSSKPTFSHRNCSVSDNWHFLRHNASWGISLPPQGAGPSPVTSQPLQQAAHAMLKDLGKSSKAPVWKIKSAEVRQQVSGHTSERFTTYVPSQCCISTSYICFLTQKPLTGQRGKERPLFRFEHFERLLLLIQYNAWFSLSNLSPPGWSWCRH